MSLRLGRAPQNVLLVMGIVWVVAGGVATQASAAACDVKLTKWVLCSGGNEIAKAPVVGSNEKMLFVSKIGGAALKLGCEEQGAFQESTWEAGAFKVEFDFKKCKVEQPAVGCGLANPTITTESLVGSLEKPVIVLLAKFEGSATVFGFEITECESLKGKYTVTGSQKCEATGAFGSEEKSHQYICKKNTSILKMGPEPASLSFNATAELTGFATWSMSLN